MKQTRFKYNQTNKLSQSKVKHIAIITLWRPSSAILHSASGTLINLALLLWLLLVAYVDRIVRGLLALPRLFELGRVRVEIRVDIVVFAPEGEGSRIGVVDPH